MDIYTDQSLTGTNKEESVWIVPNNHSPCQYHEPGAPTYICSPFWKEGSSEKASAVHHFLEGDDWTQHMPPEDMISQKVVTIKTVCSIKAFGILGVKLHNFQNTFHQLFWRYGNPDMHFLGTLKIEFPILDV